MSHFNEQIQKFLGKNYKSMAALVVFFKCQIPPGYPQIKFTALYIVKTQPFLTVKLIKISLTKISLTKTH
jgi:hypothetical protein